MGNRVRVNGNVEIWGTLKYASEVDVMKSLKIDNLDSIDQEKMLKFVTMLPEMDSQVAQKLVEQFPNFRDLALGVLKTAEATFKAAIESNDKSQENVYQAWAETRQILKGELQSDDLTWEQRKYILELLVDIAEKTSSKDSEAKEFVKSMLGTTAKITLGLVAGALVFVGAKALNGKDLKL